MPPYIGISQISLYHIDIRLLKMPIPSHIDSKTCKSPLLNLSDFYSVGILRIAYSLWISSTSLTRVSCCKMPCQAELINEYTIIIFLMYTNRILFGKY